MENGGEKGWLSEKILFKKKSGGCGPSVHKRRSRISDGKQDTAGEKGPGLTDLSWEKCSYLPSSKEEQNRLQDGGRGGRGFWQIDRTSEEKKRISWGLEMSRLETRPVGGH